MVDVTTQKNSVYGQRKHFLSILATLFSKFMPGRKIPLHQICRDNYSQKLKELSSKYSKVPIRVLFLVRENSKWAYQSLYEELASKQEFEPIVVVTPLWLSHIGKDCTRDELEINYKFFKSRDINVEYGYKNGEYVDLKHFNPDIVFYDQPWDLPEFHKPCYVSKFALTCYVPYGFPVCEYKKDYTQEFHRNLYRLYIPHELIKASFERLKRGNSVNCVAVGYSKLDAYIQKASSKCSVWKDDAKKKVIYAPHHSFEKKGLRFATFEKNGKFILEYAKSHPEISWVFKPHPRFQYALIRNGIMTQEEVERYYREWEEVGTICTTGDYFEIFKSSDLLITDCCSFLAEYMPTGKPILQLKSKHQFKPSSLGKLLMDACYSIVANFEIEKVIEQLIVVKNDFKKEQRKKIAREIFDEVQKSSSKICNDLIMDIRNREDL